MSDVEKRTFSVSREDFPGDLSSYAKDIFLFSARSEESMEKAENFSFSEAIGFDFQNELNPVLEIDCDKIVENADKINEKLENIAKKFGGGGVKYPDDFSVFIILEDIGLGIRKNIYTIDLTSLLQGAEKKRIDIDLKDDSLGFYLGFRVRCYLSRMKSDNPESGYLWSKSQIIADTRFEVKATVDKALFDIAWTHFQDAEERKHILFYVDWESYDVSDKPHTDCFRVVANIDLKDQFKRLENTKPLGDFSIRLIFDKIISNLVENTLYHAKLDEEPNEDSLHKKIRDIFINGGLDFDEYAKRFQDDDMDDRLKAISEINGFVQRIYSVGSTLEKIPFGGYRK